MLEMVRCVGREVAEARCSGWRYSNNGRQSTTEIRKPSQHLIVLLHSINVSNTESCISCK
jgi:hypothetical protein